VRLTTPRFSGRELSTAITILSARYRPLGSCSRAAGWSAATLCIEGKTDVPREPGHFRFWALFGRDRRVGECLLLRKERKSGLRGPIFVFDPGRVKTQSVLWFPLLNRGGMMKGFVQGADRQQTTLLPECLDDWVGESNPVRAVDVFVDALELRDLGFDGVDPAATGRPAYHPSPMLKLYIYGYLNRVQSSRRLEREAGRNLEVMWLTGRLRHGRLQRTKCGRHHEPSDCRARGHQRRHRQIATGDDGAGGESRAAQR